MFGSNSILKLMYVCCVVCTGILLSTLGKNFGIFLIDYCNILLNYLLKSIILVDNVIEYSTNVVIGWKFEGTMVFPNEI
jgi:hypothetical protein